MKPAQRPRTSHLAKWAAGVGLLIATSLFVVACGGSDNSSDNTSGNATGATSWNLPNADLQNTRQGTLTVK